MGVLCSGKLREGDDRLRIVAGHYMNYSLCDKYGFDEIGRRRRFELSGFEDHAHEPAGHLPVRVIRHDGARIINAFYDTLLTRPETTRFLDGGRKAPQVENVSLDHFPGEWFPESPADLNRMQFHGRIIRLDMRLAVEIHPPFRIQGLIRSGYPLAEKALYTARQAGRDRVVAA